MPDGVTSFNGTFAFIGTGVTANMFDPTQGAGTYSITALYTPMNAVGTSTDPDNAICTTTSSIQIVVNDVPIPQFSCPVQNINSCDGPVTLNAMDGNPLTAGASSGAWSGTGAAYINDMGTVTLTDDIIDPSFATLDVPFTLQLTLTSLDGCTAQSDICTFTIIKPCNPNPVIMLPTGLRRNGNN